MLIKEEFKVYLEKSQQELKNKRESVKGEVEEIGYEGLINQANFLSKIRYRGKLNDKQD